jgi:hypothetical protein
MWLFEDVDDGDLAEDLDRQDDEGWEGEVEAEIIIFSLMSCWWWRQAHDEGAGAGAGGGPMVSCDSAFADESAIWTEQNRTE